MQYQAQIKRKYSLEEIARAVGGEISGGQVRAPGPGHSTKDRSLSIKLAADGDFIIHSFANDDAMECRDYVRERLGEPQWKPNGGHDPVTASYVYETAEGKPYLRVQRTASKRFWQQHFDGSGWQPGAPKGARIPYRLPDLLAAETVYFVEGEKDADRVADLGYVATTISGGAKSKWVPEFDSAFAGKTIYIIPDNDDPGEEFAQRVAGHLHGVAARVSIIRLPGLGPRTPDHGKDVSDWLDLGNLPENIGLLADDAEIWAPPIPKDSWRAHAFTAASLKKKDFPPTSFVVPGLFPEGVTILAGRPKVGKSWMALDIALGIAGNRFVLGDIHLEEGDVLYAALEDNQRRLQSRIRKILGDSPWPTRLTLATRWRRLDAGGIADAREWAANVKNPRLMIFDTLAGIRGERNAKDTTYEGDYRALQELQQWTGDARFGGLILTHTRKADSPEDKIDAVSGTLGLAGCVDTVAILNRSTKGPTLYIRGRDVDEQEKALHFNKSNCRWTIIGEAREVHQAQSRNKILTFLTDVRLVSEPMGPKKIAEATDMSEDLANQTLGRMVTDDEVIRVKRGLYIAASRTDLQKAGGPSGRQ
jgi:hypothetical protein